MFPLFITNQSGPNKNIFNNGASVTTTLSPPIILNPNKKYQMRLLQAAIVYCQENISAALNNNTLSYSVDGVTYNMTFADGLYSLQDINNQLSLFTNTNNEDPNMIQFYGNDTNSTVYVYVDTPLVIFASESNSIMSILGFSKTDITLGTGQYANSETRANLNSLQTILVSCDVVTDSYFNSQNSNILASIIPNVSPAGTIIFMPFHPIRCRLFPNQISQITFNLLNQEGVALNMNPTGTNPELWSVTCMIEESDETEKKL